MIWEASLGYPGLSVTEEPSEGEAEAEERESEMTACAVSPRVDGVASRRTQWLPEGCSPGLPHISLTRRESHVHT